jgi:hypothetical protein
MKTSVMLGLILILQGLNAFGQTNVMLLASRSVPYPELKGQNAPAKLKAASVSVVLPQGTSSRNPEIQPVQMATFPRINREGLLLPRINNDPGAALETIFGPGNGPWTEAGIRSPIVTIFPPGR